MKRKLLNEIQNLKIGDLICVCWFDASTGKNLTRNLGVAAIDLPVSSWGVFLGVLGKRSKHIVLAQNSFRYSDGLYDIDYTAIPLAWTSDVNVIQNQHVEAQEAERLVKCFLLGGRRAIRNRPNRIKQKRVKNHERAD